jgi:hypothetical protein
VEAMRRVLLAASLALLAACGGAAGDPSHASTAPSSATSGASPGDTPAGSGSSSPSSSSSASSLPSAAGDPSWATALGRELDCDGPPARMGAVGDPTDGLGEPVADAADGVLPGFLGGMASAFGYLPLDGWGILTRTDHWILAGHLADGRARAVASFTDGEAGFEGTWVAWQVAACDPSEFADGTTISLELIRWTDEHGAWVPTTTVREAGICHAGQRRLRVDGHEYVRDPDGWFATEDPAATFAVDVALPPDARATPYRDGERRIWLGAAGDAAYVGTLVSLERWPRAQGDDASVTDCN